MPSSVLKSILLLVLRVFGVSFPSVQCLSALDQRTHILTHEFLREAEMIRLVVQVRWPLLACWLKDLVAFRVLDSDLHTWIPTDQCEFRQGPNRYTLEAHLTVCSAPSSQHQAFHLEVFCPANQRLLGQFDFTPLEREQLLSEPRLVQLDLVGIVPSCRAVGDQFHDQIQQFGFTVVLRVDDHEHRSLLNELEPQLEAELTSKDLPARALCSWKQPIHFSGPTLSWSDQTPASAKLFPAQPGQYTLSLRLGHKLVAARPFRIVLWESYIQEAHRRIKEEVLPNELEFMALDHSEASAPLDVVAEDFQNISVQGALDLAKADPLLPALEMSLVLLIRCLGTKTEVGRYAQTIFVTAGRNAFHISLPVTSELFREGSGHYEAIVRLDDRLLTQQHFSHKTRQELKEEKATSIFQSLVLSELKLFVQRNREKIETSNVYETDQAILPTFTIEGEGFDAEAPALQWPLRVELVHRDSKTLTVEKFTLRTRAGRNRCNTLQIPIQNPERTLQPGHYQMRLLKKNHLLTEYTFSILSLQEVVAATEQRILANLHARDERLLIECERHVFQADQVPSTARAIRPELTLLSSGYNDLVPSLNCSLQVHLDQGNAGAPLLEIPLDLTSEPLRVRGLKISLADTALATDFGPHRLDITVSGHPIACFHFSIASPEDVLRAVRVAALTLNGESNSSSPVYLSRSLCLDRNMTIAPTFVVSAGILAPDLAFPASAALCQGSVDLAQVSFQISMDRPERLISIRRLGLSSLPLQPNNASQDLTLNVSVGGESKASVSCRLSPAGQSRLTDIEGSLRADPDDLAFDHAQYQQIIRSIA